MVSFRDALLRTLSIPVMEEVAEPIPFDTKAEFSRIRSNHVNRIFDISQISKPEEEEPLTFDLNAMLKTIK